MSTLAKRRTLHIWIAFLAILFSAFAPAIGSAAMASATMEVCTSDGIKLIQVAANDGNGDDASGAAHHAMQHCAFCTTHAGTQLPPVPPAGMLALEIGRSPYPSLFYRAPQPLHAWSAANPRAPPFLA